MKIGIVPMPWGYAAVCLPPYDGSDWELSTPVELQHDMLVQLRGQVLHRLAEYCHDLAEYMDQLPLALLWAGWGIFALAVSSLWSYGAKYWILYGWVRFLFFFDGVWLLTRTLAHGRGLLRARQIREKISLGQWVSTDVELPTRNEIGDFMLGECTEREYIRYALEHYPQLKPYYDEMLRVEEPWVFSAAPMGIGGMIKYLLTGVKAPKPILIFDLGDLS